MPLTVVPGSRHKLLLSSSIGLVSFLVFSYFRSRWPLVFASRTKLKGFSPHEAHAQTSEFTILQIVGLDAAVLLSFYKTSFYLFSVCSIFATTILMPINWKNNAGLVMGHPTYDDSLPPGRDLARSYQRRKFYLTVHFLFTYLFTILALYFLYKITALHTVLSIRYLGRTVMLTSLPVHLCSERALAEYFENYGVKCGKRFCLQRSSNIKGLLDQRTKALLELRERLDKLWSTRQIGRPHRKRPTIRPGWFTPRVDALEYLEAKFKEADAKPLTVAFVTFEKCPTRQAPEPRDIVWDNIGHSRGSLFARELLVLGAVGLLFFFWIIPITALASLLSYKEIKKVMPWLGRLSTQTTRFEPSSRTLCQSVAVITLNALLPFIWRARSMIEYSLLRKYFLFLLVNVVFIFLLASTYLQLVRDPGELPAKIPEKLAEALQKGQQSKHFFLSYVVLQGLGIMPLQLLNLGVIIPRMVLQIFATRTPRDFAELNAPPMINYGVVYPQAILIFVITILYSVVQPLIVVFGAIYFGVGYLVYKYKLLFVFFKPYESQGQAWPITFVRLVWGIVIFQVFMIGILTLRQSYIMSSLLVPLLAGTVAWSWYIHSAMRPLSHAVSLSSVSVTRLREEHPVAVSEVAVFNLSRRRYAQNDDTFYVAPEDERTDYSQPPMANWYYGVLNTGKRRYGHPALTGVLPEPWLPLKKGQTLVNSLRNASSRAAADSHRASTLRNKIRSSRRPRDTADGENERGHASDNSTTNPWAGARVSRTQSTLSHRLSFDPGSGVIMLPEDDDWLAEEEDSSGEDYSNTSPPSGDGQGNITGGPRCVR
ncbi:hypothetical protein EDC04DRAFT_2801083 [Pisolithus marmoratus]|nr:hypothetical protein EDC04DRAFT_2801083 [Pisolithus marmoratus]